MGGDDKPLTAAEIGDVKVYEFLQGGPRLKRADEGLYVRHSDYVRLLSMLQPPTDAAKCDVCGGSGELQDAQAWDCGQDNSPCPYCGPTDAAVREAVGLLSDASFLVEALSGRGYIRARDAIRTLLSFVRAVQAQPKAASIPDCFGGPIAPMDPSAEYCEDCALFEKCKKARAVQSPRLTGERLEALKTAYLHVRNHGPQHDANVMLAVFPELQEMHERVFGQEG